MDLISQQLLNFILENQCQNYPYACSFIECLWTHCCSSQNSQLGKQSATKEFLPYLNLNNKLRTLFIMNSLEKGTNKKSNIKITVNDHPEEKFQSPKRNSIYKTVQFKSTAISKSPLQKYFEELEPLPDLCILKTPKAGLPEEMVYLKTPDHRFTQVESKMDERLDFDELAVSARKHLETIQGEDSIDEYQQSQEDQNSYEENVEQESACSNQHTPANNYATPRKEPVVASIHQQTSKVPKQLKANKICCNCKKSRCLKLYCQCFRNNQLCSGCNCVECSNIDQNCPERYNAMVNMIEMNPQAFCPKIQMQKHTKGCNCKKSNCLKKYCQCYQAGLGCSQLCRCQDCKNMKTSKNGPNKPNPQGKIYKQKKVLIDS